MEPERPGGCRGRCRLGHRQPLVVDLAGLVRVDDNVPVTVTWVGVGGTRLLVTGMHPLNQIRVNRERKVPVTRRSRHQNRSESRTPDVNGSMPFNCRRVHLPSSTSSVFTGADDQRLLPLVSSRRQRTPEDFPNGRKELCHTREMTMHKRSMTRWIWLLIDDQSLTRASRPTICDTARIVTHPHCQSDTHHHHEQVINAKRAIVAS